MPRQFEPSKQVCISGGGHPSIPPVNSLLLTLYMVLAIHFRFSILLRFLSICFDLTSKSILVYNLNCCSMNSYLTLSCVERFYTCVLVCLFLKKAHFASVLVALPGNFFYRFLNRIFIRRL